MAKVLATVSGVALRPGISKNRRYYSPQAVARAVKDAQVKLAEGSMPLSTRTHHGAEDDSTRIVGAIRSITLAEDGSARFTADIADTEHGRTIASLLDSSDGAEPFLRGVSIRGAWNGKVRRIIASDDEPAETADSLTLHGLDYTAAPGVSGAQVDAFAWTRDGTRETTERVLITESVQEALVTITEETAPAEEAGLPEVPEILREALSALEAGGHIFENGICLTCEVTEAAKDPKKPYGDVQYADPGYQADKKKRYPLDVAAHIRSAWSYINQARNAKKYTASQIQRIKDKIKAAMARIGAKVTDEGWKVSVEHRLTEAVAEYYGGDPECSGSYSLTATNGPTSITVCSYGLKPADLAVILSRACEGASAALSALDPDMDGDIDVPGASAEDTDRDAGESAPDEEVTETTEDPAPDPAAAAPTSKEGSAVSETTTQEAAQAPVALSRADVTSIVTEALAADRAARESQAKAERKAAKKAAKGAAETAPAAAVTESADEKVARLVKEGIAAALGENAAVTETDDEKVARLVQEGITAEVQRLAVSGQGPARKGLVTEHSATRASAEIPADLPFKDGKVTPSEEWTQDENRAVGRAMEQYVLGSRASI